MSFASVVGHARMLTLLSRAIARDALPPALLLAGPAGVGKKRVALAVAETLNCLQPRVGHHLERDACGTCVSCTRIARRVHPDVLVIEPDDKGTINVATVRDAIDRAAYRPFEGRRRIVMIDEADAMNHQAQSALLKTLEEPPSLSAFILVSSMADELLPTIRSRCPRLRFPGLTAQEVADVLVRDHGYAPELARTTAVAAGGSVGRALEAEADELDKALTDARSLLALLVRGGEPSRRIQLAKALFPSKSVPAKDREFLAVRLRALGALLRDLSVVLAGGSPELLAHTGLATEFRELAGTCDIEQAGRYYALVDRALAALERNASAKLIANWLVVQV